MTKRWTAGPTYGELQLLREEPLSAAPPAAKDKGEIRLVLGRLHRLLNPPPAWPALNAFNAATRFATLYRDRDDSLSLSMGVRVDGGVTAGFLQKCCADWAGVRRKANRLVRAESRSAGDKKRKARPRRSSEFRQQLEAAMANFNPPTPGEMLADGDEVFGKAPVAPAPGSRRRRTKTREKRSRARPKQVKG